MSEKLASSNSYLLGDGARTTLAHDEFNLERIAKSVAALLLNRVSADGYTIGIEGEWGSGKTSLSNFIAEEIKATASPYHKLIHYDPWLVGKRNALLGAFFETLIANIRELEAVDSLKAKLRAHPGLIDRLVGRIESYVVYLDAGASVVETVAPYDPTGKSFVASVFLKGLSTLAKLVRRKPVTLEGMRKQIKYDLRVLEKLAPGTRFTIIIDDMDRLDPEESIEILRLIKAVADFPLVTYLVCFDRAFLAMQIKETIRVGTGHDYLEKIFQNIIALPPQEPFALRRFARKLLYSRFPKEFQSESDAGREKAEREAVLFDRWVGKFVSTPRDAVRLCEAVTLGWPYLEGKADFVDYVWLQLINLKCSELYAWTRDYVVNIGSYRDGGRPGDQEPRDEANKLIRILNALGWPSDRDYAGVSYFLPGTKSYVIQAKPKVFELAESELAQFEKERRLGSPSHWRIYYSFDAPTYALEDDVLARFRKVVGTDTVEAAGILRGLLARPHNQPAYYLQIFLDRIFDSRKDLSKSERIGIAKVFADVMDEINESSEVHFGSIGPWRRAMSLMDETVAPRFAEMVASAPSVNWLASVMRDQGFALGRPDPARTRTDRQWLTQVQFDDALQALLHRFRELGIEGILRKPQPLTILYCWKQLGDEDELKNAIALATIRDNEFLDFLEALRSWVNSSSRGLYRPLQTETVGHFVDPEAAKVRLEKLAGDENIEASVRTRAQRIEEAWKSSDD